MIEIVFSDSACGSLRMAQHYGEGDYPGGCTGVIISNNDGSQPTQEEISAAQKAAEEQNRLEWEKAVPMGGNLKDVFGFDLMLSVGDISADNFIGGRQKSLEALWSIYPDDPSGEPFNITDELQKGIEAIRKRLTQAEEVRIWYSNQPDELCGFYWFMSELQKLETQPNTVYIVKLPEHEYRDNDSVITHSAWGEISPGEWHRYTSFAEATTSVFRQHCALKWSNLQKENAPLRAVLNGQLLSVPETIYDYFICHEIDAESDEFQEVMIVGRVLGKYHLGIGDAWVAHRIEKMIHDGKLSIVSDPVKGMPIYHRRLRKNQKNM